mgnify:CR=1 FL=1
MHILKFSKNCIIGKNNYIQSGVKLFDNIVIGDNNKIYDGTVIYPNTKIGNNNVILNNNILGEHPIVTNTANNNFEKKIFNGLEIGNNNFFHVSNLIFNGYVSKTIIGNNNKFLAEGHIGHDTNIHNNVVLYPRVITGGISTLMDYSTIGMQSSIQQNSVLGKYSMIGMGNIASHNVFPYFIYFNQKYLRLNNIKIPDNFNLDVKILNSIIDDIKIEFKNKNEINNIFLNKYDLSPQVQTDIIEFLDLIKIKKI